MFHTNTLLTTEKFIFIGGKTSNCKIKVKSSVCVLKLEYVLNLYLFLKVMSSSVYRRKSFSDRFCVC